MKIIRILDNEEAVAELDGVEKEVNLMLIENIKVGEYVMVHAGFAIQRVDREEVEETLKVLREYSDKLSQIR
jgi:hydrogenase expression/formation protein HypC